MDIKVLASGSKGNAYVVSDGETRLLIECGIPYKKMQERCGFSMTGLEACLLSHEHSDHSKAAAQVIKNGIDLYCSAGTATQLGLSGHRVHRIEPLHGIRIGTFIVKPFDVQHDCKQPFGYLLRSMATNETLLFATDTYYIKYRFEGLTHIMVEANYDYNLMDLSGPTTLSKRVMHSHMSIDNLKDFFRANDMTKVRQIYLLHLSNDRSNEEDFKRVIEMLTGAEVYIA